MNSDFDENLEDSVAMDNEVTEEDSEDSYESVVIGNKNLLLLSDNSFLYSVDCETEGFNNGHATAKSLKFPYPNSWTEVWDVGGGYVLASNAEDKICLLNPKTLESVILPDSPSFGKDLVCCESLYALSCLRIDPDHSVEKHTDYKVLQISFLSDPDAINLYTLVDIYSTTDGRWRRTKLDNIYNIQPECSCRCHLGSVMQVLNNRECGFTLKDKNMPLRGIPRVGKRSVCPRCNWFKCGHPRFVKRNEHFFEWACTSNSDGSKVLACFSFFTETCEVLTLPHGMGNVSHYRLLKNGCICIGTPDGGRRLMHFDYNEDKWADIAAPMPDSEIEDVLNGKEVHNVPASFTAKCVYYETFRSIQERIDAARAYVARVGGI